MQSVSSRIWTRVAVSIYCDDNHYTTGTSSKYLIYMYKEELTSNNLQWLIGHKTQPEQTKSSDGEAPVLEAWMVWSTSFVGIIHRFTQFGIDSYLIGIINAMEISWIKNSYWKILLRETMQKCAKVTLTR